MTNKENLKNTINNDFSKENNYNKIINRIERKRLKLWKLAPIAACLVLIFTSLSFINNDKKILQNNNNSNTTILNINNLESISANKIDADIRSLILHDGAESTVEVNLLDMTLTIPSHLNKFNSYAIYTRENKKSEYNILNSYVYLYSDKSNDKCIRISFSKDTKPLRDYHFSTEGSKDTIINNTRLKIFQYENLYFTEFYYKDYNFDIETDGITENELSNLLISIIN